MSDNSTKLDVEQFEGSSKFGIALGINLKNGSVEKYGKQNTAGLNSDLVNNIDLADRVENIQKRRRLIEQRKKSRNAIPIVESKSTTLLNYKPNQRIFEVRPFGIHSLENFLENKIKKASRTSQGTQTTICEKEAIHPTVKTVLE